MGGGWFVVALGVKRMNLWLKSADYAVVAFIISITSFFLVPPTNGSAKAAYSANECPASNFRDFTRKFADDKTMQATYTKYPLAYSYVDAVLVGLDEVKIIAMSSKDIPYITKTGGFLMPGKRTRLSEKLVIKFEGSFDVRIYRPETDYNILFRFKASNGCWILSEIVNQTL